MLEQMTAKKKVVRVFGQYAILAFLLKQTTVIDDILHNFPCLFTPSLKNLNHCIEQTT